MNATTCPVGTLMLLPVDGAPVVLHREESTGVLALIEYALARAAFFAMVCNALPDDVYAGCMVLRNLGGSL